jgi:CBS domain-containing protein
MKAREIMTDHPACCLPDDTLQHAAQLMEKNDCGCLPVVEDTESNRLIGVVTDRDLALRGMARGKDLQTPVREVMSDSPSCCSPEDEIQEVERIMAERQVRRVPVINDAGCCVGMIAQADLIREEQRASDREVREVVERISEPSREPRSDSEVGRHPDQVR